MKKKDIYKDFRSVCEHFAVLMAIKEQSEMQGSETDPAENIKVETDEFHERVNYFFEQLYIKRRKSEDIEAEFRSRKN